MVDDIKTPVASVIGPSAAARAAMDRARAMNPEELLADLEANRRRERSEQTAYRALDNRVNCGLRADMWRCTLESYKPRTRSQREALAAVEAWLADYPNVTRGLGLWGDNGTGKEHLLRGAVQRCLAKAPTDVVRIYYASRLEQMIYAEWREHGGERPGIVQWLRDNARLVVIADMHKLYASKIDCVVTAMEVLTDAMESEGRPILCYSSNFDLANSGAQIGEDMASRLFKLAEPIKVIGPDARRETPPQYRQDEEGRQW